MRPPGLQKNHNIIIKKWNAVDLDGMAKKTKSTYEPERVGKKDGQVD